MLMRLIRQYLPDALRPLARRLRRLWLKAVPATTLRDSHTVRDATDPKYAAKLQSERATFDEQAEIHELPEIFHYWSNKYLRPMFEEYGFSNPDQLFIKYLMEAAQRTGSENPRFLSVGSGNCDAEVRVAVALKNAGLQDFVIECLELSPPMLERGLANARACGVEAHLRFTETDFNRWRSSERYDAVMANQSLHHVMKLEHLFDAIKSALLPQGLFITSDTIGRNGHMRWPEALKVVHEFWRELPPSYRYNRQLQRHEKLYKNWDCSSESFEGIRAQDILPELMKRFHFKLFIAANSVIDVFVDRSFGHHFNVNNPRDLDFVDRVHAYDEQALASGELTPTRLVAVMTLSQEAAQYSRNLDPARCVRRA
jgi:SAM-dependent methyltransferase